MTADHAKRLLAQGESQTVEFKSKLPPPHILGRVLAGFANSGGGTLLIGVGDGGEVLGLSERDARYALHRIRDISSSLLPRPATIGDVVVNSRLIVYVDVDPVADYLRPIATSRGEIVVRDNTQTIEARPQPRRQVSVQRQVRVFVAMSFREEEEPSLVDYWEAMKRAAQKTGLPLDLRRIDLKEGDFEISQEIMNEIDGADIVVADFTLGSRNVYFELGYARGKDVRIVQTARKETMLEFDVRAWRTIFYRNATQLEEQLGPAFEQAYADIVAG